MYAKSLFAAALAMLAATGVAANGIILQGLDGTTHTPGQPLDLTWLYAPNDPTWPGFNGADVVSFQLIDYRLGNDRGQLVGTAPFATAPLQAEKVSAVLPDSAPGPAYRLAMTVNGKTVYSAATFTIGAGGAAVSSVAAPAASSAVVAAPTGTSALPSALPTAVPSVISSIAPSPSVVVSIPGGSKTTVGTNPTGLPSAISSAVAAATEAAKSGASSSAPALIALAAPAVAVFFL
ncbi:hypothetical protein HDU86_000789 [Geranomyces michiganensis]|nr:hypothetical protein HDU86_000789 [Geranomyces michiganensis]